MSKSTKFLALYAVVLSSLSSAETPTPSLEACSVHISLGMSFEEVSTQTHDACKLTKLVNKDAWLLSNKEEADRNAVFVGFKNNHLAWANRSWLPSNYKNSIAFAKAIVVALQTLTETSKGATPALVHSEISHGHDGDYYSFYISLQSGHTLFVSITQDPDSETNMLSIDEKIGN
jgi:hypothetical protein